MSCAVYGVEGKGRGRDCELMGLLGRKTIKAAQFRDHTLDPGFACTARVKAAGPLAFSQAGREASLLPLLPLLPPPPALFPFDDACFLDCSGFLPMHRVHYAGHGLRQVEAPRVEQVQLMAGIRCGNRLRY